MEEASFRDDDDMDFESAEKVCNALLDLADELESMDRRIHHITVDLKVFSGIDTDMTQFLMSPGHRKTRTQRSSILAGVESAKKPFRHLTKTQQFEAVQRILKERIDLTNHFEKLRQARAAVEKSTTIKKALGIARSNSSMDPDEMKFVTGLLEEQLDLNQRIAIVEKERIRLGVEAIARKAKVVDVFARCCQEVELMQKETDERNAVEQDENQAPNASDDAIRLQVADKRKVLMLEEARATQMKFLIQKLILACPSNATTYDAATNDRNKKMMLFCGKTVAQLRDDLVTLASLCGA